MKDDVKADVKDDVKNYEVTQARFIGGQYCAVGDRVQLTERAAKYYIDPHGTGLTLVVPAAARLEDKAGAKAGATTKPAAKAKG
jgi:hypothetical protein